MKRFFTFVKVAWSFWKIYKENENVLKVLYTNIHDLLEKIANVKAMWKAGNIDSVEDVLRLLDLGELKHMIKLAQTDAGVVDRIADDLTGLYKEEVISKVK